MYVIRKILTGRKYQEQLKKEKKELEEADKATASTSMVELSRVFSSASSIDLEIEPSNSAEEIARIKRLMTARDNLVLKLTWKQLNGRSGIRKASELFTRIFELTLSKSTATRRLFSCSSLSVGKPNNKTACFIHGRHMATFLDFLITGRKSSEADVEFAPSQIGRCHGALLQSGFISEIWEVYGQCLAETLAMQELIRGCPNGARTWNKLIAILTDRFRAGFDQRLKEIKQNRTSYVRSSSTKSYFHKRKVSRASGTTPHLQHLHSSAIGCNYNFSRTIISSYEITEKDEEVAPQKSTSLLDLRLPECE